MNELVWIDFRNSNQSLLFFGSKLKQITKSFCSGSTGKHKNRVQSKHVCHWVWLRNLPACNMHYLIENMPNDWKRRAKKGNNKILFPVQMETRVLNIYAFFYQKTCLNATKIFRSEIIKIKLWNVLCWFVC